MILTVDIGNTNISVAGFTCSDEPDFVKSYPDNLFHRKEEFVEELGKLSSSFSGAVLCSVVPALTRVVKNALEELCPCVKVVDSNFNDGLRISGYDRHKLGNDRVADMTAVKTLYPLPAVIFDMGTATTASVVDREKEILVAQMKEDPKMANKPDAVLGKIVEGKIGKFYKENCLVEQQYVIDNDLTVGKYVDTVAKEQGGAVKVASFVRFEKGEGIQKREDDFASEVMSQIQ